MARSVGDVLVVKLGTMALELAQMTARAETAEEAMAEMKTKLDALTPTPKDATQPKEGT